MNMQVSDTREPQVGSTVFLKVGRTLWAAMIQRRAGTDGERQLWQAALVIDGKPSKILRVVAQDGAAAVWQDVT